MTVRVLLVLVAFAILYGCGQASSPVEKQEERQGAEPVARGDQGKAKTVTPSPFEQGETTQQVVGNMPIAGAIGESVETPQFDYRVLDYFVADTYYYMEDPSIDEYQDRYSEVGKFVVVNYSVRNTSPQTVTANLGASLHVRVPDGKVEVYDESDQVAHPHTGGIIGGPELAPREVLLGQFIFDVPAEVQPELLAVFHEDEIEEPRGEAGVVDLTESDPQGPRPEEILALQWEYANMTAWKQAYDLFAQESKDRVPLEVYVRRNEEDVANSITEYAFPSVEIQGDHATIERVFTYEMPDEGFQDKDRKSVV